MRKQGATFKEKMMKSVMLMAGILVMLSIIIPHHHHENGMPCCLSLEKEIADANSDGHHDEKSHDCGCAGHNTVVFSDAKSHLTDGDIHAYMMPLLAVFDYYVHLDEQALELFLLSRRYFSSVPLEDLWIGDALGLRAPPVL
jgi:hypothetical protein